MTEKEFLEKYKDLIKEAVLDYREWWTEQEEIRGDCDKLLDDLNNIV